MLKKICYKCGEEVNMIAILCSYCKAKLKKKPKKDGVAYAPTSKSVIFLIWILGFGIITSAIKAPHERSEQYRQDILLAEKNAKITQALEDFNKLSVLEQRKSPGIKLSDKVALGGIPSFPLAIAFTLVKASAKNPKSIKIEEFTEYNAKITSYKGEACYCIPFKFYGTNSFGAIVPGYFTLYIKNNKVIGWSDKQVWAEI